VVEVVQVCVVGTAVAGSVGNGSVGNGSVGNGSVGNGSVGNGSVGNGDGSAYRPDDAADLAVFVDRLAAAGSDAPTASARAQIRRSIDAGHPPPGVRHLAEALAASVTEAPPPRHSPEYTSSVVTAMRSHALVVLTDADAAAVAVAVAALLADARRVVVTGSTPAELAAVRGALPAEVVDRVLDRLPALPPGQLRELRRLLATSTPGRRARADQQLPSPGALPAWEQVARLCLQACRPTGSGTAASLVLRLLTAADPERRAAVTAVARLVSRSLEALPPRSEGGWSWVLLSRLIHGRHRGVFDRMLEDTAQAVAGLDRARSSPPVSLTGPLAHDALDVIRRYRDFLGTGGRSRSYFRAPVQREVQPVLRAVRVDARVPETADEIGRVIDHLELGQRLARVDTGCAETSIPAPRDETELRVLAEGLVQVAAAARSVGALRHDVLFIAPDSPLSVPDVETAEQVARAILDYAKNGSAAEAVRRLDRMADDLATLAPIAATAPEHELATTALRARDVAAYAAAVDALEGARREVQDETRCVALERRLAASCPRLAQAWRTLGEQDGTALGLACFVPTDALLGAVPPPDSADVVVVLGAARLGVERLLLTGVAPRMIAAVGPDERHAGAPTLLSVLQRAAAPVIRGRSGSSGRVVRLGGAGRPMGVAGASPVGQAGA